MLNTTIFRLCDSSRRSGLGLMTAIIVNVSLSFTSVPAGAQPAFDVTTLAQTCLNCHAASDNKANKAVHTIPQIAGRVQETLLAQLLAFKSDTPPPATTIMNRIAKGYSDEELAALAAYLSKQAVVGSTSSQGGAN